MAIMKDIPEFKIKIEPVSKEAESLIGFKYAPKEIGTRSKIGGVPNFIQENENPVCPSCKKEMTFYSQLDSIGDKLIFADCGMIYVFACFGCYETKSFIQSN